MAHWFHRNPLKATAPQDFNLKMVSHDVEAIKILSDLKQARARVLQLLPDPHHSTEQLETAIKLYLSLTRGFLEAKTSDEGTQASKLRHAIRFRWTHSMLGAGEPESQHDAVFELANLMINVGLWHMKHAGMIASKDDLKMEEAKDIHTSLRKASGIMKFVQDTLLPQLIERPKNGSDLDVRVIAAYLNQCTAEAQEVTIARAIELKHNPGLISALANETTKMYTTAADSLGTLDQKIFGHWRCYFLLKARFYAAYAYNFAGENLLAEDKCGEAIRALQESQKCFAQAVEFAKEYSKVKGPGTKAKPEQHAFFRRLAPIVKRTLEKCERENGLIYHQKVAYDPPELEIKDKTFGLVSPEAFELPTMSSLWTAVAYASFDTALTDKEKKKQKAAEKAEGELKPVQEVPVKQSETDPKTDSGCVVS